jgi:hypothetical protein
MRLTRLKADFNEEREGTIWASLHRVPFVPDGEPRIGQWIELWDHEGNTCWGVVTDVNYPIVYLKLDPSTWKDGDAVQIEPEFVGVAPTIQSKNNVSTQPFGP